MLQTKWNTETGDGHSWESLAPTVAICEHVVMDFVQLFHEHSELRCVWERLVAFIRGLVPFGTLQRRTVQAGAEARKRHLFQEK